MSWEAATRRLINACMIHPDLDAHTHVDRALVSAHNWVLQGKRGHAVRHVAGGSVAVDEEHANSFHGEMLERRAKRERNEESQSSGDDEVRTA